MFGCYSSFFFLGLYNDSRFFWTVVHPNNGLQDYGGNQKHLTTERCSTGTAPACFLLGPLAASPWQHGNIWKYTVQLPPELLPSFFMMFHAISRPFPMDFAVKVCS